MLIPVTVSGSPLRREFESGGRTADGNGRHRHVERRHVLHEARLVHVEVDAGRAVDGVGLGIAPADVVVAEGEPVVFENGDRVVALHELVGGVVVVACDRPTGAVGRTELEEPVETCERGVSSAGIQ